MNRKFTLAGLVLLAVFAAPDVLADKDKSDSKRMNEAGERAELQVEHEQAMKMRERDRERAEQEEGFGGDLDKGQQNAATRGNEKAQEMRARRDERKRIKEEYDATGAKSRDEVEPALESDDDEAPMAKKDKKPWWKFWGD